MADLSKVVNVSGGEVTFRISGDPAAGTPATEYTLPSGGVAWIQAGYCARGVPASGDFEEVGGGRQLKRSMTEQPSIIEKMTNGCVLPVSDPRANAMLASVNPSEWMPPGSVDEDGIVRAVATE